MLSLFNSLPSDIHFNGESYPVDFSFNGVLYAFSVLKDPDLTDEDKAETFARLLVNDIPAETDGVDWIEFFYVIQEALLPSKKVVRYDQNGEVIKSRPKKIKPDFDFDFDADELFSAFMQAYHIDLIEQQGKLHWFKFIALLRNLPEDTNFMQIRQIRSTDLSEIKDKERKKAIRKAKKEVALPDDEEEGGDTYE